MRSIWMRIFTLGGLIAGLLVTGCNGSSSSGSGSGNSTTTESATGVWTGSDSVTGDTIAAFINSGGQATFIRSDGVQFDGTVQVSGSTLAVTVDGYQQFPTNFSDGSNYGIGTLNGTVTTASSISATLSFTTNAGTSMSGTWSLTYASYSTGGSSTSAVSGNYTDSGTDVLGGGTTLSITSSGVMSAQSSSNNCVLNGSISTADTSTDVYEVSYTLEDCTGTAASLNGVQFTGLASLNTSLSTPQLVIAVSGATSSNKYAIVSTLSAS